MPASPYDLHTHSTASDGTLSPTELIQRARQLGVRVLALTDHDTTAGLDEARAAAGPDILVVPGVEISVSWQKRTLHIVGLHIDPTAPPLRSGLERLQSERMARAERMAASLGKAGIDAAMDGARRLAGEGVPTRTHFARLLVRQNRARNVSQAFKRYLKPGKPGYAAGEWAGLDEAVSWLHKAGGQAVLAHPLRYGFTGAWLRRALTAFTQADGDGLEVTCGTSTPPEVRTAAGHAAHFGLLASAGSDYHGPENPWVELGRMPALPENLTAIWENWSSPGFGGAQHAV